MRQTFRYLKSALMSPFRLLFLGLAYPAPSCFLCRLYFSGPSTIFIAILWPCSSFCSDFCVFGSRVPNFSKFGSTVPITSHRNLEAVRLVWEKVELLRLMTLILLWQTKNAFAFLKLHHPWYFMFSLWLAILRNHFRMYPVKHGCADRNYCHLNAL